MGVVSKKAVEKSKVEVKPKEDTKTVTKSTGKANKLTEYTVLPIQICLKNNRIGYVGQTVIESELLTDASELIKNKMIELKK